MITTTECIFHAAETFKQLRGARLFAALCACAISACAVPGMQMGEIPSPILVNSRPEADIFNIDGATIARLREEKAQQVLKRNEVIGLARPKAEQSNSYIIGPEDVLRVTVWDHPELNNPGAITGASAAGLQGISTVTGGGFGATATDSTSRAVNTDGTMFYPYVGIVQVAGKTSNQVQAFIQKALAKSIKDPQVEVVVATYRSKRIYVTGEVKNPGVVPITDVPLTVTDAVAAAGGTVADTDFSDVTLSRDGQIYPIDLEALLYRGDLSNNLILHPGDVLNVPDNRYRKVFVLGEVMKASSFLIPRGRYSLTEALSDAGGANQITANAGQIYVIRSAAERPEIFYLDAARPDALVLADSFDIEPRDVVFVDAAGVARFNRVISQILPTAELLYTGKSTVP